ncbi:uncharacterized protein si:ch211-14c7.2 [Trichomycterus rosablanca]|uniref:uncharacterized protein si:ch211-14c7.2 n=1 Tax=Trichomycterus rosablanca TaxID=2290929 RepID=UPI002F35B450
MSRSTGEATPPSNLPNPNSLKSLISQDEEGVEGERLALTPDTELLAKKDLVQDKNKVANKGTGTVDEEEEDEFGFFMKAGDEQIWNKGSNELRIVPCEKQDDMDYSDANEPPSWASDWTEGLPINQSGSSWTAFKQDSRELETECWFSSAVENANLTKSSLINVFSGAFPTVIQPCEDSEFVPTLKELLQAPEQRNRTVQEGYVQKY